MTFVQVVDRAGTGESDMPHGTVAIARPSCAAPWTVPTAKMPARRISAVMAAAPATGAN